MAIRISTMILIALFLSVVTAGTAWAQFSVSDPVPLLNGTEKAKVLYSIPYVYASASIATCVSCTSTDKSTASFTHYVGVELFADLSSENDLTLGEGVELISSGGDTEIICTLDPASVGSDGTLSADAESNNGGSGRIVATTTKLICTAFLVPVVGDPPSFMTILPLYKGFKQKGGM